MMIKLLYHGWICTYVNEDVCILSTIFSIKKDVIGSTTPKVVATWGSTSYISLTSAHLHNCRKEGWLKCMRLGPFTNICKGTYWVVLINPSKDVNCINPLPTTTRPLPAQKRKENLHYIEVHNILMAPKVSFLKYHFIMLVDYTCHLLCPIRRGRLHHFDTIHISFNFEFLFEIMVIFS